MGKPKKHLEAAGHLDGEPNLTHRSKKATNAVVAHRVNRVARMYAHGGVRSEIIQYGVAQWGLSERQMDEYIKKAKEILVEDFEIDRRTFTAEIMSQLATIQKECRRTGNYSTALGAINSMMKLAQLVNTNVT